MNDVIYLYSFTFNMLLGSERLTAAGIQPDVS